MVVNSSQSSKDLLLLKPLLRRARLNTLNKAPSAHIHITTHNTNTPTEHMQKVLVYRGEGAGWRSVRSAHESVERLLAGPLLRPLLPQQRLEVCGGFYTLALPYRHPLCL